MAQYHNFTLHADPPVHRFPALTVPLTPSTAHTFLSSYLSRSASDASLHPDAWLGGSGVRFGPRGAAGITMHCLSRIAAGLGGEDLEAESKEELVAKFGEDEVRGVVGRNSGAVRKAGEEENELKGDDTVLDEMIAAEKREMGGKTGKKRKRGKEERVEAWVEKSASEAGEGQDGWMSKEVFERSQEIVEGEVGERDGDGNVAQNGTLPAIVTHHADGEVRVPKKAKTADEKAARKAAKKAKLKEQKKLAAAAKTEDG